MTRNQQRFLAMLEEFPRLATYWDRPNAELFKEQLEQDLQLMSAGEAALARFFASLWLGHNEFEFDVFRHISDCDTCAQRVIAAWITDPFFP